MTGHVDSFNCADDNTICVVGYSVYDVLSQLKNACDLMLIWFTQYCMQANAKKCQLILFSRHEVAGSLNVVGGTAINSEPVVKLLGGSIDRGLSFNDHITLLCEKAGKANELTTEANLLLFRSCCIVLLFGMFVV